MRDIIMFVLVFGALPFVFKRPAIGVMLFTWLSLMNPHRLCYGAAYDFPFAAVVAVVTLASMFISKNIKKLPLNKVTVTLILFFLWMTFTSFFSQEPDLAWSEWDRVMKTFFMTVIALMIINEEWEIKAYTWTLALSLGFYGIKGGIFTILHGGSYKVNGPENSYIADNNDLALALLITVPLIWSLRLATQKRWLSLSLTAATGLTLISAFGSYSRGALLGMVVMLGFLWLKSRRKFATGLVIVAMVPLVYTIMPDQWFERMGTISTAAEEDSSAKGRINAWYFAVNIASQNLTGGGFKTFTPRMFRVYAPNPLDQHAPHSIYFQVLGEHGYVGELLFLLFLFFTWRTGTRIIRACKDKPDLKWVSDLAAMCQVSFIGYFVGGAFLSLAYFDFVYDIMALLVVLERYVQSRADATVNLSLEPVPPAKKVEGVA
jgi:probable O-glycosylation ligase (exosortase A-associated)